MEGTIYDQMVGRFPLIPQNTIDIAVIKSVIVNLHSTKKVIPFPDIP